MGTFKVNKRRGQGVGIGEKKDQGAVTSLSIVAEGSKKRIRLWQKLLAV